MIFPLELPFIEISHGFPMAIFGDGTPVTKSLGVIHQINIHHGISNTLFIIESNTHLYIYIY